MQSPTLQALDADAAPRRQAKPHLLERFSIEENQTQSFSFAAMLPPAASSINQREATHADERLVDGAKKKARRKD
jgi:hypothetical protein